MTNQLPIIPYPASVHLTGRDCTLADSIPLVMPVINKDDEWISEFIQTEMKKEFGITLQPYNSNPQTKLAFISLELTPDQKVSRDGAYTLTADEQCVMINAGTLSGLFYGVQTLLQITHNHDGRIIIPGVEVFDQPRFSWRGMHLDICRHFFPVEFIKKYIDMLALHKMNVFHWHLTDDQGWRIEIKKYPRLTEVGAWRKETDGQVYGGFYSQAEIKDIVNYARKKCVTIVPEIELPGHARAALAGYPEYSCTGGPFDVPTTWGVFDDVYCPGKEETFTFLENILTEVTELFPGQFVHIGGDECPKARWQSHDLCQHRMKESGLENEDQLQAYFVSRIGRHLEKLGKRLIGWDEILDGGAPEKSIIMAWRNVEKGIEATSVGHDVVMTPMPYCYFDHYQAQTNEPKAIGGFTPVEKVYEFEPIPADLPLGRAKHILGAQGNVWTEYMHTTEHVEYMVFPRLCALSEVLWSPRGNRSWPDFLARLKKHLLHLDRLGVNYRHNSD